MENRLKKIKMTFDCFLTMKNLFNKRLIPLLCLQTGQNIICDQMKKFKRKGNKHNAELQRADPGTKVTGEFSTRGHIDSPNV